MVSENEEKVENIEVYGRDQGKIIKYVDEVTEEEKERGMVERGTVEREEGSIAEEREENMPERRGGSTEGRNTGVERGKVTEERDQKGIPKRRMKTARKGYY